MQSSFFFLQLPQNPENDKFIKQVSELCGEMKRQAYIINKPLGDSKYIYDYDGVAVLLMPKQKIIFVDFRAKEQLFTTFVEDFIEDLGSISDKYRYKEFVGRPRNWANLIHTVVFDEKTDINEILEDSRIDNPTEQRRCELLISLLTGSINDIDKVRADIPESLLDQIKRKIVLFDGDQTRFIYQNLNKPTVRIQGLSGTGKTELLLHKLKELYIEKESKIVFTCHNKILADNLRKRIPDFFNFMKVEQQILWNERLWCMHAWGSTSKPHSGTYRYICEHYGIPFETFGSSFEDVCARAIQAIERDPDHDKAFGYMLIDESQDFPESFFSLCEIVTENVIFIAGDIFQSIFDANIKESVEPDYLLSKCYRTDPRTLMFSHALGMGLFEPTKLRWLETTEWEACGYIVEKFDKTSTYRLRREPLRRFEDIDKYTESVKILSVDGDFYSSAAATIISIINSIKYNHPTAEADDIGVILMDSGKAIYELADRLEQLIPRSIGWQVNKAYESKRKESGKIFVSNRNNVKGLEFPFVICITKTIFRSHSYRNALYMTLTRSFLETYFVLAGESNSEVLSYLTPGLEKINKFDYIEAEEPSPGEKEKIRTTIKHIDSSLSFFEIMEKIFHQLSIREEYHSPLFEAAKNILGDESDPELLRELVEFNYQKMLDR